jgi:hypothetical protein
VNDQTEYFDGDDESILAQAISDEALEVAAGGQERWAYTDINNFTRRGFCC